MNYSRTHRIFDARKSAQLVRCLCVCALICCSHIYMSASFAARPLTMIFNSYEMRCKEPSTFHINMHFYFSLSCCSGRYLLLLLMAMVAENLISASINHENIIMSRKVRTAAIWTLIYLNITTMIKSK